MATKKAVAKKPKTVKLNAKTGIDKLKKGAVTKAAPKKKLGNAKPKPATKKVAAGAKDHWFAKLSKKAQAEYIKTHPNSKFAKGAKVKAVTKEVKKKPSLSLDHAKAEHDKLSNHKEKARVQMLTHKDKLSTLKEKHKKAKTPEKKAKLKLAIAATREKIKTSKQKYNHAEKKVKSSAKSVHRLTMKTVAARVKAGDANIGKKQPKKVAAKKPVAKKAPKGDMAAKAKKSAADLKEFRAKVNAQQKSRKKMKTPYNMAALRSMEEKHAKLVAKHKGTPTAASKLKAKVSKLKAKVATKIATSRKAPAKKPSAARLEASRKNSARKNSDKKQTATVKKIAKKKAAKK